MSRIAGLACAGLVTAGVGSPARAEQDPDLRARPSEMTAAMLQRGNDLASLTPEVSAVHTRIASPGPAALSADGRPMNELAGVNYRLWMSRGRTDVGVGLGTLGYVQPGFDGRTDGPRSLIGAAPALSVGLRYRVSHESSVYADALGARGLGVAGVTDYVNTKVGVEWKPATSRFGFDHGAIGVQLDSGYRLALKARHGGLGLYLRGQF